MGTLCDGHTDNVNKWKVHIFNHEFMVFPSVTAFPLYFYFDPRVTVSAPPLADPHQVWCHSSYIVINKERETMF